jgi:hypothetical protein
MAALDGLIVKMYFDCENVRVCIVMNGYFLEREGVIVAGTLRSLTVSEH